MNGVAGSSIRGLRRADTTDRAPQPRYAGASLFDPSEPQVIAAVHTHSDRSQTHARAAVA